MPRLFKMMLVPMIFVFSVHAVAQDFNLIFSWGQLLRDRKIDESQFMEKLQSLSEPITLESRDYLVALAGKQSDDFQTKINALVRAEPRRQASPSPHLAPANEFKSEVSSSGAALESRDVLMVGGILALAMGLLYLKDKEVSIKVFKF